MLYVQASIYWNSGDSKSKLARDVMMKFYMYFFLLKIFNTKFSVIIELQSCLFHFCSYVTYYFLVKQILFASGDF